MGIDLTQLLAAVTGGAQGLATAEQQDEQRKRQQLQDALSIATHKAAMQKIQGDAAHQQQDDYLKGVRQGAAPNVPAMNTGLDVAAGVAGQNLPGAASVSTPLAVQAMRQAAPETYSPTRFQQINPQSYVDTTATPEAVADRARIAADQIKQQQQRGEEDRKVHAMIGTKLPNGQTIDEPMARAMIASPSLGAAYARPPQAEQRDHFQVSTAVDAQGHPIVINTATGEEHASTGQRPTSNAQNAEQQKEQKRVELMTQGYETMKSNAQGIRGTAIAMAIQNPTIGNALLNRQEQNYLLGLRNFIAGEMHAESGARLSKEQLAFGFQRYGPQVFDKNATEKLAEARRALEGSQRSFGGGPQAPAPDVRNDAANTVTINGRTFTVEP